MARMGGYVEMTRMGGYVECDGKGWGDVRD